MSELEIGGNLSDRLEMLTHSLGYPFSGRLSRRNIVVPKHGDTAITGTFHFSTLIEFGASNMYPLTLRDFDLDAAGFL